MSRNTRLSIASALGNGKISKLSFHQVPFSMLKTLWRRNELLIDLKSGLIFGMIIRVRIIKWLTV